MDSGINSGAIPAACLALLIFGFIYNLVVHAVSRRGLNEGYVWLEVVIGVAVTLIAAGFIIGWLNVAVLLLLFAASGLFPAGGDIHRYVQARRAENNDEQ